MIGELPTKYKNYLYKKCLSGDFRNQNNEIYIPDELYYRDYPEELRPINMSHSVIESKFIIREDLNIENIENTFANLDLMAHMIMGKYKQRKKQAYTVVCEVFKFLFTYNTISIKKGFQKINWNIMMDIIDCAYNRREFDLKKYPSIESNCMKHFSTMDFSFDIYVVEGLRVKIEELGVMMHDKSNVSKQNSLAKRRNQHYNMKYQG